MDSIMMQQGHKRKPRDDDSDVLLETPRVSPKIPDKVLEAVGTFGLTMDRSVDPTVMEEEEFYARHGRNEARASRQTRYTGLIDHFKLGHDGPTGVVYMPCPLGSGKCLGILETDPNDRGMSIFRWHTLPGETFELPLHWHRVVELIIQVEGRSHFWGRELEGQFWEVDLEQGQHLVIPSFKSHAVSGTGEFLVVFAPAHPIRVSHRDLPEECRRLLGAKNGR